MQYAVVVEREGESYGAYVPDLPGCVAVGESEEEALELIRVGIALHLEAMRESGDPIPEPSAHVEYVEVAHAG